MALYNILLIIVCIIIFGLMVVIFISNHRRKLNLMASLFMGSLFVWVLANLLTNLSSEQNTSLTFARLTLVGAAFIPVLFLFFVYETTNYHLSREAYIRWLFLPVFIVMFTPTSLNIASIEPYGADTVVGPVYLLLIFEYFVYFYRSIQRLRTIKNVGASSQKIREQVNYIYIGIVLAMIPALITNGIMPTLGLSNAVYYGPTSVVFLAAFTSAAIFKHGLFDIKLVVARSIAYVLSVLSIIILYGVIAINLINKFVLNDANVNSQQRYIYIVVAIITALSFNPIKIYFNKLTEKLFFRDSYDLQEIINQISDVVVKEFYIDELINESTNILVSAIKPRTGIVILVDKNGQYYSDYDITSTKLGIEKVETINELSNQINQLFIVNESLTPNSDSFNEFLNSANVSLSIRLMVKNDLVGYMLFGPKLSGDLYSGKDIQLLSISANELSIAIQNARRFDEISRFNETLKLEVERATTELKDSNEKLQALDQAKDEFISMASHQLRTPLTSVKGYLSMVLGGDVGKLKKQQKDMISSAFNSSQRMVYLISDLLNVSRLQTGKFVIEPTETNMPDVVESELDQLKETFRNKKLNFIYKKPKNFPILYIDETKTRQVIMNFLDNAIYYTPSGGKVEVLLTSDEKKIELKIKDSGIGVPKSERHNLFTKFYRATNAKKVRPDGTGLGLFMARKVIVDQGGAIIFDSKEGEGSTFGFTFPLTRVSPPKKDLKNKSSNKRK